MDLRINKNKWQKYKFEDFVDNIREQAMPLPEDSEKYIGLEHLDSGSLHIKRWDTPIQLKGTKFRMRKGDLLFARRNAYLKRVAIAPHDGLFSAHGMVFRPKESVISSDFLPFFLSSDTFWDRAIQISVGSLSPTINWGTLRHEEFKLPPLPEQKRLADLLWSVDKCIEKKQGLIEKIEVVYGSYLKKTYAKQGKGIKRIQDVCKINNANLSAKTDPSYRFKYLDISSIIAPDTLGDLKEYTFKDAPSRARRIVSKNSLVLSLVRPYFKAFVIIKNAENVIASTGTAVLDVKKGYDFRYIFHSFFSKRFGLYCEQKMNGTNYPAITPTDVKNYEIFTPSIEEQVKTGDLLSNLMEIKRDLICEVRRLKEIMQEIINQIFG